ncbi:MAG: DUF1565 domain-containing protein [Deltaproteobacteria bacterium]|nr:DUF1565 domain-containing protein [Deltaproteobacteria bacterium]
MRTSPARATSLALVVVALCACGDDAVGEIADFGPRPDAGRVEEMGVQEDVGPDAALPDGGAPDAFVAPIEPPAPPAPPDPTCADRWTPTSSPPAAGAVCSPWPAGGQASCPPGEAHFPGTPGCVPIGSDCPVDGWPAAVSGAATVYVRGDAAAGGSGTRDDPFVTIAAALADVTSGTTVAIARGRYDEAPIVVPDGVTLLGACARDTVLGADTTREPTTPMIDAGDGAVVIRDLTLEGPEVDDEGAWTGIGVGGGSLTVESVVIGRVAQLAIGGDVGSTLIVRDVLVSGVRSGGTRGAGVAVGLIEATATVERLVAEGTSGAALYAAGTDARLDVSDFALRDVRPTRFGEGGWGVTAERGAEVVVRRGAITGAVGAGIGANGAHIDAEHIAMERISDRPRRPFGASGVYALAAARVELRHAWLRDCDAVVQSQGSVTLEDVVAWSTAAFPELGAPAGVIVRDGALSARRVVLGPGLQQGFYLSIADATLEDVVVTDTGTDALGLYGNGIVADGSTTLRGERIQMHRTHELGLLANGRTTTVVLSDVTISEVQRRSCADGGCGSASAGVSLGSYGEANVAIDRFVVTDGAFLGVQLASGGTMDLTHGVVRRHPLGANVQTLDFALDRITSSVRYEENERDLDATFLPLPSLRPPM